MARLHQEVMRELIAEIVTGARPPGDKLPKEVDLANQFGVSRGVSRETIRALEERGLISVRHGKGATVNADGAWNLFDPAVLAVVLETGQGADVLREYVECRQILEVEAAGIAATRARRKDVQAIKAALKQMEEAASAPATSVTETRFHEADLAFHQALIAATGNRALGALLERIHSALFMARFPLARPEYRQERGLPEHRRILAAVEASDADAARKAMSDHLDTIAGYLNEYAREQRKAAQRRRRR